MTTRETRVWTGSGWAQIAAPSGRPGKSAYDLAVDNGFTGTFEEWYTSMRGATGPAGPTGPAGAKGDSGIGVPTGGTTGQVLVKNSNSDFDFSWKTVDGITGSFGTAEEANPVVTDGTATGGIKTSYYSATSGYTYNVHTFLYSNDVISFTNTEPFIGKLLIIAGGGGGGGYAQSSGDPSGGGGAGGLWYGDYAFGAGTHNIYIGAGGVGGNGVGLWGTGGVGYSGEDSWIDFDVNTQTGGVRVYGGGGGGGSSFSTGSTPSNGGSGGGGVDGAPQGLAIPGRVGNFYGNNGGGTSGGGAFQTPTGLTLSINGTSIEYARGGTLGSGTGVDGRGNGGGGVSGGTSAPPGATGGSGAAIIRYRIA